MSTDGEPKVRSIRFSRHFNATELSRIVPLRTQNSSQSADRPQIGIRKSVIARNRGLTRTDFVQGAEISGGGNIPCRLGIYQFRLKMERFPRAPARQSKVTDVELQRRFSRICRVDHNLGIRK